MSLINRLLGRPNGPAVAPSATPEPCQVTNCLNPTIGYCAYQDQRQVPCGTSWCASHSKVIQHRIYCRRHTSYAEALVSDFSTEMLPNVESRAPSLVKWVSDEIDERIRAVILAAAPYAGCQISTGTVRPVYERLNLSQRWLRSWKLVDLTSVHLRVSLEVCEHEDSIVITRVNDTEMGRHLPPWIGRDRSIPISPEEDAAARAAFRDALLRDYETGLAAARTPGVA